MRFYKRKTKYRYECIKCGNCCREIIEIEIFKEDILKWIHAKKEKYTRYIQINPISVSPIKLATLSEKERDMLIDFILRNHTYRGEGHGFSIERPFLKRKWGSRPILTPKTPEIALKGIMRGLNYIIMNEFHDQCPFLKGNLCVIHDLKPIACKRFPLDENNQLRLDDFVLTFCRGIKRL